MPAINWNTVLGVAPELTSVNIDTQVLALAYANESLSDSMWGTGAMATLARAYMAAHIATITVRGGEGASGAVVSESAGGLSRTYAQSMASASTWGSTPYGVAFASLLRTNANARGPGVA